MAFCPHGHASAASDYCDQCGARIDGAPSRAAEESPAGEEVDTSTTARRQPCPGCRAPRSGDDRFCEECGHDFLGTAPPAAAGAGGGGGTASAASEALRPPDKVAWEAVVTADRSHYERHAMAGVVFPDAYPARCFPLEAAQIRIGRARPRPDDPGPEINLGGPPADPAISQLHAVLDRRPDGSYGVRDLGSTNGTTLNDDPAPLAGDLTVGLRDGDRLHLGAWTTITVRRR